MGVAADAPRVLVAMDSFKGSVSSAQAGRLVERGVRAVCPAARVRRVLVADGGEGTVEALASALGAEARRSVVAGPLGRPVEAAWCLAGEAAVVETASAAGLSLSPRTPEAALAASSRGVGELVLAAVRAGARRVVVGLGGSATSDGGAGMARALGVRLLDEEGRDVPPGLAGLAHVSRVDAGALAPELAGVEVVGLTDVTSPLVGPAGAVAVFGPQKGLDPGRARELDGWMRRYARLVEEATGVAVADLPGAGAAGGLGAALVAFLGSRLESGIGYVLDAAHVDALVADADLVITGEGRMDAQTACGKAPVGVARRAKACGVPCVAVVGSRADDVGSVYEQGIGLVVPCVTQPCTLAEALARTPDSLPRAARGAMRAFLLSRDAARLGLRP